jgi:8-oxo-dGTP pyrophosphatase MutT (NUDIX family)
MGGGALSFHVFVITSWIGSPHRANDEHSELRWFDVARAAEIDLSHPEYQPLLMALRA